MKFRITDVDPDVQFGPKPKDVFIKLPFKGQQSNTLKDSLLGYLPDWPLGQK